jgi:hypothetical protein
MRPGPFSLFGKIMKCVNPATYGLNGTGFFCYIFKGQRDAEDLQVYEQIEKPLFFR